MCVCVCVCARTRMYAQSHSCLTFDMGCNPPGSSVHGILKARILEWVVISFSRRSSQPRNWTQVSRIAGRFFTSKATREALTFKHMPEKLNFSWWELGGFLGIIYSQSITLQMMRKLTPEMWRDLSTVTQALDGSGSWVNSPHHSDYRLIEPQRGVKLLSNYRVILKLKQFYIISSLTI